MKSVAAWDVEEIDGLRNGREFITIDLVVRKSFVERIDAGKEGEESTGSCWHFWGQVSQFQGISGKSSEVQLG